MDYYVPLPPCSQDILLHQTHQLETVNKENKRMKHWSVCDKYYISRVEANKLSLSH